MGKIIKRNVSGGRGGRLVLSWLAVTLALVTLGRADKVVLRIRAANPINTVQTVSIKSTLPARVSTNDVVSLGGLELGYDIKSDRYYVFGEMELGAKEIRTFDVELADVWEVELADVSTFEAHARQLVAKLAGSDYAASADGLLAEIETNLASVVALQGESGIGPGVKPMQHIRAYEANLEVLKRIKTDLGYLENLVLGTGQDIGNLIGDVKEAPLPTGAEIKISGDYKVALLKITVQNTSPKETRRVSIEKNLPEEIKLSDVLDAGGLEVGTRPETEICYVYKQNVEIPPGETQVFDVSMRDKWNLSELRIPDLRKRADALLGRVGTGESFDAVEKGLQALIGDLDAVEAAQGPTLFNDRYVAFYRRQGDSLDRIEQRILRVESALRPRNKNTQYGFKAKPPSMKTTWLIIYVILGFLALMSLLFFLRWYGGKESGQ
ncbi:MAG: hypothetical protein HN383_16070 [Verrucomicrobia bacterium]|jgi:hypothetical protein|nr:hypothetical protein [Verrucomicrobiota bacterium]MBT7701162.1 hypothetical protein [Verrucomicrobiota bacterium]